MQRERREGDISKKTGTKEGERERGEERQSERERGEERQSERESERRERQRARQRERERQSERASERERVSGTWWRVNWLFQQNVLYILTRLFRLLLSPYRDARSAKPSCLGDYQIYLYNKKHM
jgi:hypothetical protein